MRFPVVNAAALLSLPLSLVLSFSQAFGANTEFQLDTQKSVVKWTGTKGKNLKGQPIGSHDGTLKFKSGTMTWDSTKPVGGEFIIDMSTLTVMDKANADAGKPTADGDKEKLTGHLKSADFFEVEKHPTATFKLKSATAKGGDAYSLTGDMTIRGVTVEQTLDAKITKGADGKTMAGKASMTIDRTKYGINYGSESVLDPKFWADKLINHPVQLEMDLSAGNPKSVAM